MRLALPWQRWTMWAPLVEALSLLPLLRPLPPTSGNTAICRFCGMAHRLAAPAVDEDDHFDDDDFDDEGETVAMTDAGVLELLQEHFTGADAFYLAPSIPPKKERNVRALHAAHLPAHEPILGLYDGTVFGAADNEFVITARRLCWRNIA